MNVNKPVILISNDDGYHAKGINSLIDMSTLLTWWYVPPSRPVQASRAPSPLPTLCV